MKIDLTKKPEGATHINPHSGLWVKCFGGNSGSYQFFKDGEWEMGFGCMSNYYLEIAHPEPWTGEGRPPLGMCEAIFGDDDCRQVEIVGFHGSYAVFFNKHKKEDEPCFAAWPANRFRPIPTPEQIAADEREAGINAIHSMLDNCIRDLRGDAEALWDAGYRKQVSE